MNALDPLIAFLRGPVQTIPADRMNALAREASGLRTVGVAETSIPIASLAASARALIRNLPFVDKTALAPLRMALLALSDALAVQAALLPQRAIAPAPDTATPDDTLPWHQRH